MQLSTCCGTRACFRWDRWLSLAADEERCGLLLQCVWKAVDGVVGSNSPCTSCKLLLCLASTRLEAIHPVRGHAKLHTVDD